jgi:PKD repeat protein
MGQPLAAPVIVEVTDSRGQPVEGVTVEFALTSAGAGAEIVPSTAITDAKGRAQAHVLLGNKLGFQIGEARVALDGAASPKTTFRALAVSANPGNGGPRASFNWHCQDLTCQFTDGSTDSDGSLMGWAWRFGDGGTSTERQPTHSYSNPGTYTVMLSVTDNHGSTDESSTQINVAVPPPSQGNHSPQAEFDVQCSALTCAFADRSHDDDGTIASRLWSFGDGATSTERNPSHSYGTPGRYQVILTVRDNDGAADTQTHEADPTAPPPPPPPPPPANIPPRAEFQVSCRELACTFTDQSKDDDGTIVSWQWNFGDGATSTERNPSHSYGAPGRYQVQLTVRDNAGAADTKTHEAEPSAPPPPANKVPDAEFEVHCQKLTCTFTDKSKDDDGTIVGWQWSFGDGVNSDEQNPVHTYADPGHYDVSLTVTDNGGATDARTHRADVKN